MSAHLTADQKPDLVALQDESQPSLPKLNNCKDLECHDHAYTELRVHFSHQEQEQTPYKV